MSGNAHSSLGASSAGRWMNCPASVRLSAGIEDSESIYAAEGTAAHGVAEYCLNYSLGEANKFLGRKLRDFVSKGSTKLLLTDKVVTQEMVDAVNVYLDHVVETLNGGDGRQLHVEKKVDLTRLLPDLPANVRPFGTCDCVIMDRLGKKLFVFDFKYGAGVAVGAENNAQLRYYGLGALLNFEAFDLDTVTVSIVQPRSPKGAYVKSEELPAFDLLEWGMMELAPAATATQDPDAATVPGGWCRFCKAKGRTCAAFEEAALSAAVDHFGAIVEPSDIAAKELGERFAKIPMLKEWIKTVEALCEAEAAAGRMPVGLKWVAGRGSREWSGSELAIAHEVVESTGVDITDKITLSVAQAEKRLGKKLFEKVAHLVEKKPGGPKLAPLADKRPAIDFVANAKEHFGEIETYE